MTFGEWVESDYNTKGFIASQNKIYSSNSLIYSIVGVSIGDIIIADRFYWLEVGGDGGAY